MKIRVVEKTVKKLIDYLKSFDKTKAKSKCGEADCLMCSGDTKIGRKCRKNDIVYQITCEECKKENKKSNYFGETNFNAYTRGKQHIDNYKSNCESTQEKSALRKHAKEIHNDNNVKYTMKIVKTFKEDPLARQIYESIKIVESKKMMTDQ